MDRHHRSDTLSSWAWMALKAARKAFWFHGAGDIYVDTDNNEKVLSSATKVTQLLRANHTQGLVYGTLLGAGVVGYLWHLRGGAAVPDTVYLTLPVFSNTLTGWAQVFIVWATFIHVIASLP